MRTTLRVSQIARLLPLNVARVLPQNIAVTRVSAARSRDLNRRYRGVDRATNVLSFRYDDQHGEILVCAAVVRKEAAACRHSYPYQMTWMILHGMLHLAGVHHEGSRRNAHRAERIEALVLGRIRRILHARIS